jgi:hypothetical protein
MTPRPCPPLFRATFLDEPRHVELAAGERLYKFVSIPIDRQRLIASPWWIRQAVFDELRLRARRLQKPASDLARSRMAIKNEWNPGMDTVFIVVLAAQVEGWEGCARSQPISNHSGNAVFTGGERQICVPSLTWRDIGQQFSGTLNR